jgi:hypothetical protein
MRTLSIVCIERAASGAGCTVARDIIQSHITERCAAIDLSPNRVIEPGSYAALALVAGELNEQRRTQATAEGAATATAATGGGKKQQQVSTTETTQAPSFTV